jgi:hypothetical protein
MHMWVLIEILIAPSSIYTAGLFVGTISDLWAYNSLHGSGLPLFQIVSFFKLVALAC